MDMQTWLAQNAGRRYGNYIDGEWEQAGPNAVAITNPARRDQCLGVANHAPSVTRER